MNKIRLPRDGTEYAHFTFSSLPSGIEQLEAQIGGAWYPLDLSAPTPRLLLRGPDAPSSSAVLVSADGPIRVRLVDSSETIVRGAGYVALVS